MNVLEKLVILLKAWQRRVDAYRIKKLKDENFRLRKKLNDSSRHAKQ